MTPYNSTPPSVPTADFVECLIAALHNPEFVGNWARLRGVSLPATPLEQLIDGATGNDDKIAAMFLADVWDLVYSRMPAESR